MCGIAGVLGSGASRAVVESQLKCLEHRGPDSSGVFEGRGCVLGQTRLAIIDLVRGDPPLTNEHGSICAALNGELYNYRTLQAELRKQGHRFKSECDTEVIAHLAEHDDPVSLARSLDGMFAFAVWDETRRQLMLARDRVGKKPLYYFATGGTLVFASEIKALLEHPDVPVRLNEDAIAAYLAFGYVPTPSTFFEGIHSVLPGHVLVADEHARFEQRRFWEPPLPGANGTSRLDLDEASAARLVRDQLESAVKKRLVADVPIGAFLSGGIDSSAVVALMSRALEVPVRTFTIGFDGAPEYDERPHAARVARQFGTDHTEFVVRPEALDLVERLVWHYDQPFGDSSAVPTYLLSELTKRHVTVALAGDGGDEIFAGYERFAAATWLQRYQRLPTLVRSGVRRVADAFPPTAFRGRVGSLRRFTSVANLETIDAYATWVGITRSSLRGELLHRSARPADSDYVALWETTRGAHLLDRLLHLNLKTYLVDDLLPKVDRMSMAHGLEVRSPFLDTELIELALRLPPELRIQGTNLKHLLKVAMRDLLPPEILKRRKRGFGVPLDHWFREDLRGYVRGRLASPQARVAAHLDGHVIRRVVAEHERGVADHRHLLWSLLTLEVFLEKRDW